MTHQCPRPECSRSVPDDMFACRGDWYALPQPIRDRIWAAWRAGDLDEHADACTHAITWYREHPPRYARREGMAVRYSRPLRAHETPRITRTSGETGEDPL
jgi:hypothetical protein